jgi:hypothetical protein
MEHADAAERIATTATMARAVEPPSSQTLPVEHECLNCGSPLDSRHCRHCGQGAHVHRTLGSLFHDLLHGVLHLEGKTWRTLPMLAWRPGELTRRYVAGERTRFVSPLALFLFTTFLMFAVVPNLPLGLDVPFGDARAQVDGARALVRDQITHLETARAEHAAKGGNTRKIDRALTSLRGDLVELQSVREQLSPYGPTLVFGATVITGDERNGNWISARWREAKENPDLLVTKLKNSAYKFSWALVPISLPLIWLLFARRRDVGLYDHAVFGIYSLSFVSLLTVVSAILVSVGAGLAAGLLMILLPPLHMFRQLRGAYLLRWWSALWRTAALMAITSSALVTWLMILIAVG